MKLKKSESIPKWRQRMPKGWDHPQPKYPSNLTNKQRMAMRAEERKFKKEQEREKSQQVS